jgi:cyclohexyl-isocyanide hydratase
MMNSTTNAKINVGIFIYPNMTMLDAYAPLQVLAVSGLVNVFTFAKTSAPIASDTNVDLLPNYGFSDCPDIDVLIVPGAANPIEQMKDQAVIKVLREIGSKADYITSVCTGALILAETGLLNGYKTTLHWAYSEVLQHYPEVEYVDQRVVKDGNRISGGGITSGLDFALELLAEISGETTTAKMLELLLEYNPKPPFNTGDHNTVDNEIKAMVQGLVNGIAGELFEPLLRTS